ncbi:hypothetical protein EGW08_017347 [Elysia chlorotica]|uniref:Peptidase S1 domain-containing protein n=1 Tax=Elysia chlorotica TaxID=188477 RepID=A0A433T021_ELYCH|nr:hypothetical protein EGW08_017347 [Elysia chlorotica]
MTSYFDAAEAAHAWETCTKNPGHSNFIPLSKFEMSHLPKPHQKAYVLESIQNVARSTGRIRVGYTSHDRPDDYPFAATRGSEVPHSGTAYVYRVTRGKGRCPCPDVKGHEDAKKRWWKVNLQTACHVVFNTEEAKRSTVDLFYDDKTSIEDGRTRTLYGLEVSEQNQAGDRCELICVTHEKELVLELRGLIDQSRNLFNTICRKTFRTSTNLCVVVSHPHGQHKHITVGKIRGRSKMCGIGRRNFSYDADTCRGSSGAPIFMPLGNWIIQSPWMAPHSHSDPSGDEKLNKSGEGGMWLL